MAYQGHDTDAGVPEAVVRECDRCGGEREHEVAVRVQERETREGVREVNKAYSRTPYRVYRCKYCAVTVAERIR
ncbi:DUF7835 family putative zinc beta-ribbon protein [Halogeometricum borinquense]